MILAFNYAVRERGHSHLAQTDDIAKFFLLLTKRRGLHHILQWLVDHNTSMLA
jgi:hypothetical protein